MSIFAYREKDDTMNVMVCGKVVRDAEVKPGGNGSGSRIKFSVNYGKKKFMDCEAWSDSDVGAIASCLEKGDVIAVAGTHRTWEYNGKTYATLSADMIFTMAVPQNFAPEQQHQTNASSFSEEIENADEELPF